MVFVHPRHPNPSKCCKSQPWLHLGMPWAHPVQQNAAKQMVFAHPRHPAPSKCCNTQPWLHFGMPRAHPTQQNAAKHMSFAIPGTQPQANAASTALATFWLTPGKPSTTECCKHVLFFAHPLHSTPSQCFKSMILAYPWRTRRTADRSKAATAGCFAKEARVFLALRAAFFSSFFW